VAAQKSEKVAALAELDGHEEAAAPRQPPLAKQPHNVRVPPHCLHQPTLLQELLL